MSEKIVLKEDTKTKVKKPSMYNVLIHNDDYTTMEFVVEVLVSIFRKKVPEATKIMFDVHEKGVGIAGVYTYDIASTKLSQATQMAQINGFPLKFSIEEE